MKFKYSAFTELTDEAIEWVEDILGCGMILAQCDQRENLWMLFDHEFEGWQLVPDKVKEEILHSDDELVNCLDNTPLFKAVTAMRDDSDYRQWFVMDHKMAHQDIVSGKWKKTKWFIWSSKDRRCLSTHKATLSELQEHFKIEK